MFHHHHHHHTADMGDTRLFLAVLANVALTAAQIIGGIISGSLALIADAMHNFSDAAALGIALIARIWSRKPADDQHTYGHKRTEIIAAFINLTTLIFVGLYLVYEAIHRFIDQEPITGWIVVIVAGIALAVDVFTAVMTYRMSKTSLNIKAAFLHNVSDALASVGVIVAGTLIILYGWYWVDTLLTLLIAAYIIYQGASMLPHTIHILMNGTPKHLKLADVTATIQSIANVQSVHEMHIWQMDEHYISLEAHIVIKQADLAKIETIKTDIRKALWQTHKINHATLEIELTDSPCQHQRPHRH